MKSFFAFLAGFFLLLSCSSKEISFYSKKFESEKRFFSVSPYEDGEELPKDRISEVFDVSEEISQPIDILFVLDYSNSMNDNLDYIAEGFSKFLKDLKGVDWQMAFITSNHGGLAQHSFFGSSKKATWKDSWTSHKDKEGDFGKLIAPISSFDMKRKRYTEKRNRVISPQVKSYKDVFKNTVSFLAKRAYGHTHINDFEQPLAALRAALERIPLEQSEFLRPGSHFISIIVTDEDEARGQKKHTSAEAVVEQFKQVSLDNQYTAFNVVVDSSDCASAEGERAKRVAHLAELTGGKNIDICSLDYSISFNSAKEIFEQTVSKIFYLREKPEKSSLEISGEFDKEKIEWSLVGNKLKIRNLPLKAKVQITYLPQ